MSIKRVTNLQARKVKEKFMTPKGWSRKELEEHVCAVVKEATDDDLFRFLLEQGYIE